MIAGTLAAADGSGWLGSMDCGEGDGKFRKVKATRYRRRNQTKQMTRAVPCRSGKIQASTAICVKAHASLAEIPCSGKGSWNMTCLRADAAHMTKSDGGVGERLGYTMRVASAGVHAAGPNIFRRGGGSAWNAEGGGTWKHGPTASQNASKARMVRAMPCRKACGIVAFCR
jgi:hypothetical protein